MFATKYRKKLLITFGNQIKQSFQTIAQAYDFIINEIEVDKDHIHVLITFHPTQTLVEIVTKLKSISTKTLWAQNEVELKKTFWGKKRTFWSPSYFACTTGDASTEVIQQYIRSQG